MTTLLRYWLLQIPGIVLVSVGLLLLWTNELIAAPTALGVAALWIAKDAALYPLYRQALGPPPPIGVHALIGELATARTEIAEHGLVRVRGELWQARARDGACISAGTRVAVVAAQGLCLTVERAR